MEPIVHFLIPLLILLAFKPNLNKKLVFALSIIAIAPDFDYVFGHRTIFHTLLFAFIFSFLVYLVFRFIINYKKNKEIENKNAFYLSIYYTFFHLLLDIGDPGLPLLYPFFDKLITFNAVFRVNLQTNAIKTTSSFVTNPIVQATHEPAAPFITTFGIVLLIIVSLVFIITFIKKKWKFFS